jgi:hypothetical protein
MEPVADFSSASASPYGHGARAGFALTEMGSAELLPLPPSVQIVASVITWPKPRAIIAGNRIWQACSGP